MIVGPGNVYVAIAKREVAQEGLVGVPSAFAGPSEVVVVADRSVAADFAAIDVIVQAEHGPDGLAWLISWDEDVVDAVDARRRPPRRRPTLAGRTSRRRSRKVATPSSSTRRRTRSPSATPSPPSTSS